MKKFFLFFCFSLFASFFSACGEGGCDNNDIQDAANKVTNTATAYSSDPENKDKCNAYKSALLDYLNTIDGCDGIDEATEQSYRDAVNTLDCD